MLRRRVPVLRLGSRGPGGDARSLRLRTQASAIVRNLWTQASAIVRKRPRSVGHASDMPERRKSSRNAELSSLFTFRITKVSTITGIGGVVVVKRRTVVTFGLVSSLRVSRVSTLTGIGRVLVAKRRTVNTFGPASGKRKGERREEKRYMRGEKRGERREERRGEGERKGERREERRGEERVEGR